MDDFYSVTIVSESGSGKSWGGEVATPSCTPYWILDYGACAPLRVSRSQRSQRGSLIAKLGDSASNASENVRVFDGER
jgi:hypothetical protein